MRVCECGGSLKFWNIELLMWINSFLACKSFALNRLWEFVYDANNAKKESTSKQIEEALYDWN